MTKLLPQETHVNGHWLVENGRTVGDSACRRIEELITSYLHKIGTDPTGWDTLYRDPQDGRYWELLYLRSEMHGGGPPSLIQIDNELARLKYGCL